MLSIIGIALLCTGLFLNALYVLLPHRFLVIDGVLSAESNWWESQRVRYNLDTDIMTSFAVRLLLLGFVIDGAAMMLFGLDKYIF